MFNAHKFFMERFRDFVKETSRYLQYIFNGHTAIAILFLISAGAYYYQNLLSELPPNFPSIWIIAFFFSLVVTYSPVHTLLKEADLMFLLPAEQQMSRYFSNALIFSYVMQLYLVVLTLAVFAPLYQASFGTYNGYFLYGLVLLLLKAWNLMANWWMLKIRDINSRWFDKICRFVLQFALFFFFIDGSFLYAGVTTVLLFFVFLYAYYLSSRHKAIAWDILVEKDRTRMRSFYRLANMFTDVPHLKTVVKKRHWLVRILTKSIAIDKRRAYDYLYRITLVRSVDYLGMYVRLVLIGLLAIYYIPQQWIAFVVGILFIYLVGIQTMTIWHHHRTILWIEIYPISHVLRQQAVVKLLQQLLILQTLLFAGVFVIHQNIVGAFVMLAGGLLFTMLFLHGYVKKKLQ
ncbi:Bacterial ABC transporter protein EcsB [Paraliobacillus sp. PM-2]|uniref:ABC transporter permease n=1 Tax=Paraliobacillus sp. PM-2 TaxID=1462524 RepID=UPI00061C7E5C|nr:ABC transporter permease [Paraliobacillus sp. PM-2]CQR47035.1 Bacterial ABC transporter protein EcsB [Paraliobacillus sp. PM-2]